MCGAWCAVCGVWCVVCGVWRVACGVWRVVCGLWSVVCGVWCVARGVSRAVCGVFCAVCGVWCLVCGVWCVACGVRCVVWCGVVCVCVVWCGVVCVCVCVCVCVQLDTVAHFAQGHPVAYVYFRSYILRNNIFKNLTFGADVNKLICPYFVKIVLRPKRKVFAKLLSHIKKNLCVSVLS